jgi:hypothetical protein
MPRLGTVLGHGPNDIGYRAYASKGVAAPASEGPPNKPCLAGDGRAYVNGTDGMLGFGAASALGGLAQGGGHALRSRDANLDVSRLSRCPRGKGAGAKWSA